MSGVLPYTVAVLAAGRSKRMGGPNKLLLPLGDAPIVRHTAVHALESGAQRVIVVTGHDGMAVRDALAGLDVTCVHNPDFATGMASSLRAAIEAVPPDHAGCVVLLGDMPLIGTDLLNAVMGKAIHHPEASAIVPRYQGSWAHPVLLSRALFSEVERLTGDHGARPLLQSRNDVILTDIADEGATFDADTPAAYSALLQVYAKNIG
ncbi:MAG: nucleotidyltransferase family protein [Beijerinckiaceae bacterium]